MSLFWQVMLTILTFVLVAAAPFVNLQLAIEAMDGRLPKWVPFAAVPVTAAVMAALIAGSDAAGVWDYMTTTPTVTVIYGGNA